MIDSAFLIGSAAAIAGSIVSKIVSYLRSRKSSSNQVVLHVKGKPQVTLTLDSEKISKDDIEKIVTALSKSFTAGPLPDGKVLEEYESKTR